MGRRRGERDVRKEQMWRRLLERQRRSRLSVREFCRAEALKESAFYFWRRELGRRDGESAAVKAVPRRRQATLRIGGKVRRPEFLPVALSSGAMDGAAQSLVVRADIEVELPGGTTLRVANGADAETLRVILKALESRTC